MLKKKVSAAYRLFQEDGFRAVLDRSWLRLQVRVKANRKSVRLDACTFGLEGVPDGTTKDYLLTNRYEADERNAVARYARRDLPVIELGGSIGVVACVTNKLLRNPAAHLVVEANPLAIPHLQSNRILNRCEFEVVNRAIAYGVDSVTFRPSSDMCANSLFGDGDQSPVTVNTVQLRDLVREHNFTAFTLICDIEGLEYDMVCNELDVLGNADTIIMETHARLIGNDKTGVMMNKLHEIGFRTIEEMGFVAVLQR